ncbi:hypothetical protein DFH06DRAFT_1327799 [Mycena polygramma]|nr:hypothetical protein DFH06DRAFT_1327799 [Mycena polygramma]
MADLEQGRAKENKHSNEEDEAAAAKLWAVYLKEAEKYDKGLVESWKSDMEGLLIFAALFSAILTAFIIESYTSLSSDSGDLTVQLLGQISQQLAASSNGSTIQITPSSPFKPSVASLVCNALWFISLGLSLACALIATLVQQWAREFLHKAGMRSAPVIQARVYSYLYYGLKYFRMHTVVAIIPLLLHASLLLFFGGLVAFLIPVNLLMTGIAAAVLAVVALAYSTFTLLPLRYLDCPYQTPLSGMFWWIMQSLKKIGCQLRVRWHQLRTPPHEAELPRHSANDSPASLNSALSPDETMVEAMFRSAIKYSEERQKRDYKALVWTMQSLSDDAELEPFVEAIPDLLWGPMERRTSYDGHIQCLLRHSDVRLLNRIGDLLISCDAGILTPDAAQRRQITCLRALWALASCTMQWSMPLDFSSLSASSLFLNEGIDSRNLATAPYITSARALMARSTLLAFKDRLFKLQRRLVSFVGNENTNYMINYSPELEEVHEVHEALRQIGEHLSTFGIPLLNDTLRMTIPPTLFYLRLRADEYLSDDIIDLISYHFFAEAGPQPSPPYRFNESYSLLRFDRSRSLQTSFGLPDTLVRQRVVRVINAVVSAHVARINSHFFIDQETQWITDTLAEVLRFWQPTDLDCLPGGIIVCLNGQRSALLLADLIRTNENVQAYLWTSFPRTLLEGAAEPELFGLPSASSLPQADVFNALWQLLYICQRHGFNPSILSLAYEPIMKVVSNAESRFARISVSIIALLKFRILHEQPTSSTSEMHYRPKAQIALDLAADYLEVCTASDVLPYNAAQTWNAIATFRFPIQATDQLRLASSMHAVLFRAEKDADFSRGIMNSKCWNLYAEGHKTENEVNRLRSVFSEEGRYLPWLDDPVARQKIKAAFTEYKIKLTASGDSPKVLNRVKKILDGLDSWHREVDSSHVNGEDDGEGSECSVPQSDLDTTASRITNGEGTSNLESIAVQDYSSVLAVEGEVAR